MENQNQHVREREEGAVLVHAWHVQDPMSNSQIVPSKLEEERPSPKWKIL